MCPLKTIITTSLGVTIFYLTISNFSFGKFVSFGDHFQLLGKKHSYSLKSVALGEFYKPSDLEFLLIFVHIERSHPFIIQHHRAKLH